eukprot:CAMPEP_0194337780 /NCGR_PEP_ID=MMETSP0171-20130528/77287_1 /TAXON_ID=218684 /ORGANISM="Corethron pennatum, Strain L29A3" /LENGTH=126 /DNA_ID=CAMNT_0039101663 /DNA_START=83 /DNA_END=463 /DNA_ORIENTATION=-
MLSDEANDDTMISVRTSKELMSDEVEGEEEIIVTFNENVTAVVMMGSDCPKIAGSVRIEQLVGIGGWNDDLLLSIQKKINEKELYTASEVIDMLAHEIDINREDHAPPTPGLPKRKKSRFLDTLFP